MAAILPYLATATTVVTAASAFTKTVSESAGVISDGYKAAYGLYDTMFSNVPKVRYEAMKKRKENMQQEHEKNKEELNKYKEEYEKKTKQAESEMDARIEKEREDYMEGIRKHEERLKEMDDSHMKEMRKMNEEHDRKMSEIREGGNEEKDKMKKEFEKEKEANKVEFDKKYKEAKERLEKETEEGKKRVKEMEEKKEEVVQSRRKAICEYEATLLQIEEDYKKERKMAIHALSEIRRLNFEEERKAITAENKLKIESLEESNKMLMRDIKDENNRQLMIKFMNCYASPLKTVTAQVKDLRALKYDEDDIIQEGKVDPHCETLREQYKIIGNNDYSFHQYCINNTNVDKQLRDATSELATSIKQFVDGEKYQYVVSQYPKAIDANNLDKQKKCNQSVSDLENECNELAKQIKNKCQIQPKFVDALQNLQIENGPTV